MERRALIAARDISGLGEFSNRISQAHGYRIIAIREGEGMASDETVEWQEARRLIREGEISLLVANFFDPATVGRDHLSWKTALASFDHNIVDLIRLAARCPGSMGIVGSPLAYPKALDELDRNAGGFSRSFRMDQACLALQAAAEFDAAVAGYLETHGSDVPDVDALSGYPKSIRFVWKRALGLEQGDTSRQKAAIYGSFFDHFELVAGPNVDFACALDLSVGVYAIGEFEKPTAILIKNRALLFAASADSIGAAVQKAVERERQSITRATLIANGALANEALRLLENVGIGTAMAPSFPDGVDSSDLRLIASREGFGYDALQEVASIPGGAMVQDRNRVAVNPFSWRLGSAIQPMVDQWDDMIFGVKLSRHLRSDACVAIRDERLIAKATDLPSQSLVWSRLAESTESLQGAALVFDSDIENADTLVEAKRRGIDAVVHPGIDGDAETHLLEQANDLGLALVSTGVSFRKR